MTITIIIIPSVYVYKSLSFQYTTILLKEYKTNKRTNTDLPVQK